MKDVICKLGNLIKLWRRYSLIYQTLQRRQELTELMNWAKRKHLSSVYAAYARKLGDEELRIQGAAITYPQLTRFARAIHFLKQTLLPKPHYYAGYAARYKNTYLTGGIE